MLPLPTLALRTLAALAAAKLLLHLLTNMNYGLFIDELYYLACSEHLGWGYVDQPPAIGLITWLVRHTLGESLPALRFLPALAGAATVWVAGLIARELGGGRWAQGVAALAVIVAPLFLFLNTVLSMNAFDGLLTALFTWLLVRIARRSEEEEASSQTRLWLVAGVVAGFTLLNKVTILFLAAGLGVGLLATSSRRFLRRPGPWMGGALALLLFLPHILWQVQNDWPTPEFMANATQIKNRPLSLPAFLGTVALDVNPLGALLLVAGLVVLFRARPFRFLGWAFVTALLVIAWKGGKPYYLGPLYPLVFAAGAVGLEGFAERRRWLKTTWPVVAVLLGAIAAPMALPVLPIERFIAYQEWLMGGPPPSSENKTVGPLPQHFADMFGHHELALEVAKVFNALPAEEQAKTAIYGDSYAQAGAIDFWGPQLGLPKAVGGQNSYYLWGPPKVEPAVLIVMGGDEVELRELFAEVELKARVSHPLAMPWRNNFPIYVCRGARHSLREIWPMTKSYQ